MDKVGKKERKPLFVLKVRKRHILIFVFVVVAAIFAYATYFRFYMTLPQSAVNILSDLPYSLANQKVLIVAPHCDDETLGTGGLIQQALSQNGSVEVIVGTNCNKKGKGGVRQQESITALNDLGVSKQNVVFLNLPEAPEESEQKADEDKFRTLFLQNLNSFQPTLVVLPHPNDTHWDHSMMGRVGSDVITQSPGSYKTIYYLIHYNFMRFPSPSGLKPNDYLLPPARLISKSESWYKLSLSADEESLKEEAVLKYKSQLSVTNPILQRILFDFVRQNELFMIKN